MLGKTSVSDLSEHVFDLILELYNIDSHLLLSVLPQLEFKLKVVKGPSFSQAVISVGVCEGEQTERLDICHIMPLV